MEKFNNSDSSNSGNIPIQKNIFSHPANSVAIYTVLSVLLRMRERLGLEAMTEYIQFYLQIVEKNNPEIKMAVQKALTMVDVRRIYEDALNEDKM